MTTTIPATAEAAGLVFDLSLTWIDAYGCRWTWTGERDITGTALMQTGDDTPQRLSHVYLTSGPLAPAPRPVTKAEALAAIATPVCAAAEARAEEPTPTPLAFARVVARLRLRGRSA
ncbi:phiSA1p31-related protein [Streptomyces sp. NPDC087428]|uniref:phiSA1p31-related protein n=1 Tax=Streptomyces sp. NPDC087428 TaxID=3365788 RepID=UPI0037F75EA1